MPRAVVTGGAGFLGTHLCRRLLERQWEVVAVDNFLSGDRANVADLLDDRRFELVEHDVIDGIPVEGPLDAVLHFASAASPPVYLAHPLETLAVGSVGTRHALELAGRHGARFVLASTSEIYGEPHEHPQTEQSPGYVNTVGPRAVYDEAKRFAETLTTAYRQVHGVNTGIVRLFNVFGPYLKPTDGRVISNFLAQALEGRPLTIHGDGSQTRSFCYVDDEVGGILALLDSDWSAPVNLGNPVEHTVLELAGLVAEVVGSPCEITYEPLLTDDPTRRCPDISLAQRVLGWQPTTDLRTGLERTRDWYRSIGIGAGRS
jgi:dTDP-glucose 4,6-dehydratase